MEIVTAELLKEAAMYQPQQSFGLQLREWRQRRRMSQLDLAAEAETQQRAT